jgi:hypothetical protein
VQVVDQFVSQVLPAVPIGDDVGAHPLKLHGVADRILEVVDRFLKRLEDTVGRALPLHGIVVIDQVGDLALAPHRRGELHHQHVAAFEVHPLPHELLAALLIHQARHGIGKV